MAIHLLRILAAIAGITLCALLPFLPGRYDSLATPLSAMARVFGFAGLLLVPIGALWLGSGFLAPLAKRRHLIAIVALIACCFVATIVSLAALLFGGFILAVGTLAVWFSCIVVATTKMKILQREPPGTTGIALTLVVVPVAVLVIQMALVERMSEWSRGRAIRNTEPMIADIERYRATHGDYPQSLTSLWNDYPPDVIGIREFCYEQSGDAYNLYFEPLSLDLSAREIVMYNPLDQQVMTSHNSDVLRRPPGQLEQRRGFSSMQDTEHPHWKRFSFD